MTREHEMIGPITRYFLETKPSTNGCAVKTEVWCTLLNASTQSDEEYEVQIAMRRNSEASANTTKGAETGGSKDPNDNAKASIDGTQDVTVCSAYGVTTPDTYSSNAWYIGVGTTDHCLDSGMVSSARRALNNYNALSSEGYILVVGGG